MITGKGKAKIDPARTFGLQSNAELGLPNGGINTLQWGVGLFYDF